MTVTVYSQEACPPCKTVKKYLDMKGIKYLVKDRNEYSDEMIKLGGRITTPMIHTEKGISYGFNPRQLADIL